MERQLALIETTTMWRLDERTREVGKRGVEQARQAMREAIAHARTDDHSEQHPTAA
jgi:hypothetical protein